MSLVVIMTVQSETIQRLKGCHFLLFVANNITPANDVTPNRWNVVVISIHSTSKTDLAEKEQF
ncbi:MAG: hypothetical protein LBR10_06565 [Prevotellaceae bacterium]|nr:hypothetical protein [Prevotellaceae bacterium]